MKKPLQRIFLFSLCLFFQSGIGETLLQKPLRKDLALLLNKASDLHQSFQKKNQKEMEKQLNQTQKIIKKLYGKILNIEHLQQRDHASRLLKKMEDQLEVIQFRDASYKRIEKTHKQKLFRSFIELAQVYNLKEFTKEQAFFCSVDRSTWIQSSSQPQNPITPHLKNCGKRIW